MITSLPEPVRVLYLNLFGLYSFILWLMHHVVIIRFVHLYMHMIFPSVLWFCYVYVCIILYGAQNTTAVHYNTITSGRGFDILSCLFVQFVHLLKIYTFYQALLGGSRPYIIMQCLAPQQWKVFTIHVCTCICSSSAMSSPFFFRVRFS